MVGGPVDVGALDLGCAAELRFSLEYVREDGTSRREPLAVGAAERFEEALPVVAESPEGLGARAPGLVRQRANLPDARDTTGAQSRL